MGEVLLHGMIQKLKRLSLLEYHLLELVTVEITLLQDLSKFLVFWTGLRRTKIQRVRLNQVLRMRSKPQRLLKNTQLQMLTRKPNKTLLEQMMSDINEWRNPKKF